MVQNLLLIVYAVFALFPLIWMLIISLKSDAQVFTTTFVFTPTLANYREVLLRSDYTSYMIDSLIISGGAVTVSVLVGVPAAYALARYNFHRKEDPGIPDPFFQVCTGDSGGAATVHDLSETGAL